MFETTKIQAHIASKRREDSITLVLGVEEGGGGGEREEESLKQVLGNHGYEVSNFIFLASAYEGGWPVLSLAISSSN